MKKLKNGEIIDLSSEEIVDRDDAIQQEEAWELANAPYSRLDEIDIELQSKFARMIEDLKNGVSFDVSVQELLDEKAAIRNSLTS